ncbi:DMT family transporter [Mesorhizobium escarrei]|uniref:EamA domain-containing protein n=1 Tax=Mesorhizobium escarrei TaxID=666018 RepID=A0ABN8JYQ7_9HYPH|nr:DMT family transporter [Mesorhizobium escarrei]CAH2402335.1 EamA domain-containing protein [Mesorhizobium escarrei]
MSPGVFSLVLSAAIFHATWNALVKINGDKLAVVAVIKTTQIIFALAAVALVGVLPPAAWPYLLASTAIHTGYYWFLIRSYRFGELSYVYPIARGTSPLLVALGSMTLIGETISIPAAISVGLIALGIMSLSLTMKAKPITERHALKSAVGTGICTAGYTLMDGIGARSSDTAWTYIVWLMLVGGLPTLLLAIGERGRALGTQMITAWKTGAVAGAVATSAYVIVIWASTVAPIALVSAIRETSMVFAALFGALVLGEHFNRTRRVALAVTLVGVVLLRVWA